MASEPKKDSDVAGIQNDVGKQPSPTDDQVTSAEEAQVFELVSLPSINAPKTGTEEEEDMEPRESERLLFFTDAVVAIAATLLILPLMEAATDDLRDDDVTVGDFFNEHRGQFGAFILSFFLVTDEFWTSHAFLFVHVQFMTGFLLTLNSMWIFVLMFLPVAASLFIVEDPETGDNLSATIFYLGILAVLMFIHTVAKFYIKYNPSVVRGEAITDYSILSSCVFFGLAGLAIVVGAILSQTAPAYNACAVFIFLLRGPTLSMLHKHLQWEKSQRDKAYHYYSRTNFVKEAFRYFYRKIKRLFSKIDFVDTQAEEEADRTQRLIELNKDIFHRISERLIIFTDAIVAISMTLLILPLMESSAELRKGGGITAIEYFQENEVLLGTMALSFCVVALQWKAHDSLYSYIEGEIPSSFMVFTAPWLLSIAFMPVASVLFVLNKDESDRLAKSAVYITTVLFNQLVLCVMTFIVYSERKGKFSPGKVLSSVVAVVLSIVALVLTISFPNISQWITILLFLSSPVTRVLRRYFPGLEQLVLKFT